MKAEMERWPVEREREEDRDGTDARDEERDKKGRETEMPVEREGEK